jgi:hypothetical protein
MYFSYVYKDRTLNITEIILSGDGGWGIMMVGMHFNKGILYAYMEISQ